MLPNVKSWLQQSEENCLVKQFVKAACCSIIVTSATINIFYSQRHNEFVTINFLKEHEQSSSTLSAYGGTLIDLITWKINVIATMRTSLVEEEEWCYDYAAVSCFDKLLD